MKLNLTKPIAIMMIFLIQSCGGPVARSPELHTSLTEKENAPPGPEHSVETNKSQTAETARDSIEFYKKRYELKDLSSKLVNNHGDGFLNLYGVRNFRAVLQGVLYRGGANNLYNKNKKRDNRNPLPNEGLKNLCMEGFSKAVYLYTQGYDKKMSPVVCQSERGFNPQNNNSMDYLQQQIWTRSGQYKLLKIVFESIMDPMKGPLYFHCWNGWHASGLISALSLRQFCNFSDKQAVTYWDENTDGVNHEPAYENIRSQIHEFAPFEDLKIPESKKIQICFSP